ncbi:MAG TPA: HD domain-containing phosphohydrolase [Abditibacteriaceae bacterium]|jgi:putative nucleotidyltransferase with HDIG domain
MFEEPSDSLLKPDGAGLGTPASASEIAGALVVTAHPHSDTTDTGGIEAGATETAAALDAALRSVSAARETLGVWQDKVRVQHDLREAEIGAARQVLAEQRATLAETCAELTAAHAETQLAQTALEAERSRAANLQTELEKVQLNLAAAQTERDQLRGEADRIKGEVESLRGELDGVRGEAERLRGEADHWKQACEKSDACARQHEAQLQIEAQKVAEREAALAARDAEIAERDARIESQLEQNRNVSAELIELYRDLRAEDLPTLILRIGMNLTQSESALYIDVEHQKTIAAIGLDDLPDSITQALYHYTQKAADDNEPVVCNDGDELPDGVNLVNLAALPVAVQGDIRGVMLVANKRGGEYTDEDTDLLLSIGNHAGIAMENNRLHCALADAYVSTIAVLADAIEAKDPYTRGHCESVANVAVNVAQRLGWNDEQIEHIRYAALLHDVGKIGIPDGILLKPGRLLPEEFQVIQRHASIGSDLVKRVPSLSHIAPIILHHHERVDGSGYPSGQSGDEISLASRIIGVVDAFDAMTTPRPYREPVSKLEAIEELKRCAGKQFDTYVVELVTSVLSEEQLPHESPL